MMWVLVWAVLVLAAAAVLFLLGRRLWRQTRSLVSELGAVTDRLAEIADILADLEQSSKAVPAAPPAVGSSASRRRP